MNYLEAIIFINKYCKNTLIEHLGIEFTHAGDGFIEATMPVNSSTKNPAQLLHGGAMMALAETVGSALAYMEVDREKFDVLGLEINGNHLKATADGVVTARATRIHAGKRTHVCEIKITDNSGNVINTSRMTNMVVEKLK